METVVDENPLALATSLMVTMEDFNRRGPPVAWSGTEGSLSQDGCESSGSCKPNSSPPAWVAGDNMSSGPSRWIRRPVQLDILLLADTTPLAKRRQLADLLICDLLLSPILSLCPMVQLV